MINGLFNGGAWGTGNQSSNFSIKLNEATDKKVWISYVESDEENESDNIVASYETPENWEEESITATNLTDPLDVPIAELDANKSDATKLTLYYYISDENGDCGDYAINVWGGAELTEAGSALIISAWGNQKYRTLLETDEETLPSGKSTGKWVKVGLDVDWDNGMSIDGLQFLTTEGGTDVWNLNIKNMNLTEAYYVPGENGAYGAWYKSAECLDTEKIEIPLPKDEFYIKGGIPQDSTGNADALGNWDTAKAVKMTQTSETERIFEAVVVLTQGTYQFLFLQDPEQFADKYIYKDFEHADEETGNWPDYTFTAEKDAAYLFRIENPDYITCKTSAVTIEEYKYTVMFKDGDETYSTQTVSYGQSATAPALPAKTGYTPCWNKDFSHITADTTVNVTWTANTYTLTYNVNGGSALSSATKMITYDDTLGELATPKRKGYTFKGWYTAKTKGTKVTSSTKVTGDITIYAQWAKVTKPGKVTIQSVKNSSKKAMKITLKKVKSADGYEIRYSTKKSMKSAKKVTTKKTTATIKKLKKGKTYYVQARVYKIDSAGEKVYSGKYSKAMKLTIRK